MPAFLLLSLELQPSKCTTAIYASLLSLDLSGLFCLSASLWFGFFLFSQMSHADKTLEVKRRRRSIYFKQEVQFSAAGVCVLVGCFSPSVVARPQRSKEFHSGTGRDFCKIPGFSGTGSASYFYPRIPWKWFVIFRD